MSSRCTGLQCPSRCTGLQSPLPPGVQGFSRPSLPVCRASVAPPSRCAGLQWSLPVCSDSLVPPVCGCHLSLFSVQAAVLQTHPEAELLPGIPGVQGLEYSGAHPVTRLKVQAWWGRVQRRTPRHQTQGTGLMGLVCYGHSTGAATLWKLKRHQYQEALRAQIQC